MTIALARLTGPGVEPVTLAEAKTHLRVTDDAEDAYITGLIVTAREAIETLTGRALLTQSWVARFDAWPRDPCRPWLDLPRPPLQAVSEVRLHDAAGAVSVWDPANYGVDLLSVPGRLYRNPGAVWPTPGLEISGIEILYVAGYGAAASDVPAPLRQAVLLTLAHLFENREPAGLAPSLQALVAPYRVVKL